MKKLLGKTALGVIGEIVFSTLIIGMGLIVSGLLLW